MDRRAQGDFEKGFGCSAAVSPAAALVFAVRSAFVAESEGVYRPTWTIDDVADNLDSIRDTERQWILPPVPSGFVDHLGRSFEMARANGV